jgi:hypothetical protein
MLVLVLDDEGVAEHAILSAREHQHSLDCG